MAARLHPQSPPAPDTAVLWILLGPGYQDQTTTQFPKHVWFFSLAAECGKAVWFLALVPQASNKPLGQQKRFGIPLSQVDLLFKIQGRKRPFPP